MELGPRSLWFSPRFLAALVEANLWFPSLVSKVEAQAEVKRAEDRAPPCGLPSLSLGPQGWWDQWVLRQMARPGQGHQEPTSPSLVGKVSLGAFIPPADPGLTPSPCSLAAAGLKGWEWRCRGTSWH